mgnify:FL=1
MAEILKLASSIAGEITTIIALLAIILPKSRNAIVKWLKKALEIDRVNKTLDEQSKKNEEREKLIGDLKNTLDDHVKRYKEYTARAQERDIFMLRSEIDNIYHKYMPLGYITSRAKSDVAKAWELYVAMGGNSYAKSEVNDLMALPVRF